MVKKLINKKLYHRHFWRYTAFDELIQLYTSNMFRAIASSLFSVFIPIYLLKNGYSLTVVAVYFIGYFVVRFWGDIACGFITARIGPKHAWLISHTFKALNLVCLLFLASHPILIVFSAITNALGTSFQFIPMYTNFSKIKDSRHCGKEQGYFTTLENVGMAVGPALGGVVAGLYGAKYIIIASIVLYLVSIVILLSSKENVHTRQYIKLRGIKLKTIWRDIISYSARGAEATVGSNMWPLFMMLVVFTGHTYEIIGIISTAGMICGSATAFLVGKYADSWRPKILLRLSVIVESIALATRPLVGSFGGALAVSSTDQIAWNGLNVTYNKGVMSAADDLPGYRIIYFTVLEAASEFMKISFWIILAVLSLVVSNKSALQAMFIISALVILLVNLQRFKVLK